MVVSVNERKRHTAKNLIYSQRKDFTVKTFEAEVDIKSVIMLETSCKLDDI